MTSDDSLFDEIAAGQDDSRGPRATPPSEGPRRAHGRRRADVPVPSAVSPASAPDADPAASTGSTDDAPEHEPSDPAPHPLEEALASTDEPRERESRLRSVLPAALVLIVVLALGAGGVVGYQWVTGHLRWSSGSSSDEEFPGPGSGEAVVTIQQGDGGGAIARRLKAAGVIKNESPFIALFSHTPEAAGISPGQYRLKKQMTSQGALNALLDPTSFAGKRVTVPEGQRNSVVFAALSKGTGIPVKEFEAAAKDYRAIGVPENPAKSAEGYLWPGRYDIPEKATAKSILTMMVSRMNQQLEKRSVAPKDSHRILTLASIAEKEARTPENYGKVVRTIENRLSGAGAAKGHPMLLQLDSTVAYASGRSSVSTTPKERATDSPYNTYKHPGLPIGPISNPGAAAIDAALKPPAGEWLFWVTVNTDTGETVFSTNQADHDKAVAKWKAWYAAKQKKG